MAGSQVETTGKKIGRGLLGGLGVFLATFIIVTLCCGLAFPFIITAGGGSYAESQYFLNFVVPPIVGVLAAIVAGIVGFVHFYRGKKKKEAESDIHEMS